MCAALSRGAALSFEEACLRPSLPAPVGFDPTGGLFRVGFSESSGCASSQVWGLPTLPSSRPEGLSSQFGCFGSWSMSD